MTQVEPPVKSEKEKQEAFVKEYEKLCIEHNYQIVITPRWRLSTETGDYRLILESSVGELPKKSEG